MENNVKSAGGFFEINGEPPETAAIFDEDNGFFRVSGWAANIENKMLYKKVYININHKAYLAVYMLPREDVATHYNSESFKYSGFSIDLPCSMLAAENNFVSFSVITNEDELLSSSQIITVNKKPIPKILNNRFEMIQYIQEAYSNGIDLLYGFCAPETVISVYANNIVGKVFFSFLSAANKRLRHIITGSSYQQFADVPDNEVIVIATENENYYIRDRIAEVTKAKAVFLKSLLNESLLMSDLIFPVENILSRSSARLVFMSYPLLINVNNKSEYEQKLMRLIKVSDDNYFFAKNPFAYPEVIEPVFYANGFNDDYITSTVLYKEDKRYLNLLPSRINPTQPDRLIPGQPDNPDGNIFIFGNSIVFGFGSDDGNTIASSVQRLVNEWSKTTGKHYSVQSFNCESGRGVHKIVDSLSQLSLGQNDIVIVCAYFDESESGRNYVEKNHYFFESQPVLDRPHNLGEIFFDMFHVNAKGYTAIGEALFNFLLNHKMFEKAQDSVKKHKAIDNVITEDKKPIKALPIIFDENEELLAYQKMLKGFVFNGGSVGAIVMNCNPFTFGHRYLIETAAKEVDRLYIFVVEEDKSFFPFSDRLELVKKGTADIENVVIIPSGKFIISSLTFANYFDKDENSERVVDTSTDVTVFAEKIAPVLNITKRFVGEEPLDNITRQYNASMKTVLPTYGIDVVIIKRIESDNAPISASRVRKLLETKDFESISKLVPVTTLDYLEEKYK